MNTYPPTESGNDRPLAVDQASTTSGVFVNAGSVTLATAGREPSKVESVSGTRSMLLSDQPSSVATSNRTESLLLYPRVVEVASSVRVRVRNLV